MSDNRKYYYLKLKENYFDDDSIVLLESMQDGVLYSNILLKLYLKSLKHGGRLQLDEDIPYTAQMIATITRQQIGTVERALQIFLKLGLVEVLDSGTFYMSNIELLIGQSSTEAERKRAARLQNIRELDEQLRPVGMVVTLDAIFNRVIRNWRQGKRTWILADEFYILFRYSFSAEFFYRLFKRMRKYNAFITAISQNVDEILRSDTARLMLANSELLVMLNQAATDREELAKLLNISENQLSYITNVPAGHGLIRCGGAIIPFENSFPKNTKLYQLMTTKPNEKF